MSLRSLGTWRARPSRAGLWERAAGWFGGPQICVSAGTPVPTLALLRPQPPQPCPHGPPPIGSPSGRPQIRARIRGGVVPLQAEDLRSPSMVRARAMAGAAWAAAAREATVAARASIACALLVRVGSEPTRSRGTAELAGLWRRLKSLCQQQSTPAFGAQPGRAPRPPEAPGDSCGRVAASGALEKPAMRLTILEPASQPRECPLAATAVAERIPLCRPVLWPRGCRDGRRVWAMGLTP